MVQEGIAFVTVPKKAVTIDSDCQKTAFTASSDSAMGGGVVPRQALGGFLNFQAQVQPKVDLEVSGTRQFLPYLRERNLPVVVDLHHHLFDRRAIGSLRL
ncbi:MAG: hypothetical protein ACKN81_17150, partial [Pirellulaceae bacterium]